MTEREEKAATVAGASLLVWNMLEWANASDRTHFDVSLDQMEDGSIEFDLGGKRFAVTVNEVGQ